MKIRFNKFEKVAGLFVLIAILGCILGMAGIAVKNGWLSVHIPYFTELESADGVHPGTVVQIAGLRVGSVTDVDLQSNDKVMVRFEVLEKFKSKVRKDSHVQTFRPFILADKVLEVSVGSDEVAELEAGGRVPLQSSTDIMDLLSGKKMGAMLASFDKLADSLRIVGEAFSDPQRTQALVQMLDRLNPLVQNLNTMSLEIVKLTNVANKQKHLETIITNLAQVSEQLQIVLPAFSKEVPDFGQQMGQMVKNLNTLIGEFDKLTPAINAIAPDLPRTTRRAVEALDETVVTLKALQHSFLLRGNVNEVLKEEGRRPANTSEP
jgi:phospholipid/cholesterol/gamma-HCH transport system substrate-binding protein